MFGGDPAKAWDGDMLRKKSSHPFHYSWSANLLMESSSFNAAYTELVDSMATGAQDDTNLVDDLTTHVVDVLKAVEKRGEQSKKKVCFQTSSWVTGVLI